MRDPERIDKICNKLAVQWKKVPDWRLGQLLFNACNKETLFYEEDEDILIDIMRLMERLEK